MTNISAYPLQDNFKTNLTQQWTGGTGTIYVAATPSFTFPANTTTYIVVSPGKTNMQIAKINAYDSSAKTMTVSSITLNKGASVSSTAQTHNVGAEVIISDNYQYWEDIKTAINTKVDGDTQPFPSYTTANRDLLSASNGMMIYNTTTGEFNVYQGGAWTALASGSTQPNATTTVAGKVELATSAETIAGTDTGGSASLLALPSDIAKNTQSNTFKYGADAGGDDTYVVALTPTLAAYTTGQVLQFKPTTANTGACTIDFGPGVKNIKTKDGNDPQTGVIRASEVVTVVYDGTNFVLQDEDFATTANKGIVEMCTDAEALTGTDETRYVNAKQARPLVYTGQTTASTNAASVTATITHSLGRVPYRIDLVSGFTPSSTSSNDIWGSIGYYTAGAQCCMKLGGMETNYGQNQATYAGYLADADGTPVNYTCTINNVTTTTFDIVIARSASVTNTLHFTCMVQA